MARGEPAKERPQGATLAIGGSFAAVCLISLTCVVSSLRSSSQGCASGFGYTAPREAFGGANLALDRLSWRDAERTRLAYGGAPPIDATLAEATVTQALRLRGHVEVGTRSESVTLPFERSIDGLEGACGVALIVGEGSASLAAAETADGVVAANDPSAIAVGLCGAGPVRVRGTGSARVRTFAMPGLTPADVTAIGATADVVLAHAEAEHLLRPLGWEPSDSLVREDLTTTAASTTAVVPPTATVASGCVAWVAVLVGAGRAETSFPTHLVGRDYGADRGLFGEVRCADGTATRTTAHDVDGGGATLWLRPFGRLSGGPVVPGSVQQRAITAGAMRVTPSATATMPAAFPSSPAE